MKESKLFGESCSDKLLKDIYDNVNEMLKDGIEVTSEGDSEESRVYNKLLNIKKLCNKVITYDYFKDYIEVEDEYAKLGILPFLNSISEIEAQYYISASNKKEDIEKLFKELSQFICGDIC